MEEEDLKTKIAVLTEKISQLKEDVNNMYNDIEKNYVQRSEFWVVRIIVFGMVGTIIMAFLKMLIDKTMM